MRKEITRYAEDVHAIYGYGIFVESTENATHVQLKTLIQNYQNNLAGTLFIGDVEEAMFEIDNDYGHDGYRKWPCDLYFMDLNGNWIDNDGNGIFDGHTGHIKPEIFLGRLSGKGLSSIGNEVEIIRRQLQKSHNYWWKSSFHNNYKVLNYINHDWTDIFDASELSTIFSTYYVDDIRYGTSTLSPIDYLDRINYGGYGFTQLAAHSTPISHEIGSGDVYASTIKNVDSSNYAYNLFCCSACNWLASNSCYLGGAYLFNNGQTLAVVGTTKTGGMKGTYSFYSNLSNQHIGKAFLEWWKSFDGYLSLNDRISWSYGMTLLGDPTIYLKHQVSDYCVPHLQLNSFPQGDYSNLILQKAESSITTSQNFVIPQDVNVIFDAPEITIGSGFYCPVGSTFETRPEGCEL
ncbi:MAG: hypothetical protein J6Z14_09875 [Prevotella sp.]|nr:hypothetical protein [Prevotella sp.]